MWNFKEISKAGPEIMCAQFIAELAGSQYCEVGFFPRQQPVTCDGIRFVLLYDVIWRHHLVAVLHKHLHIYSETLRELSYA